MSTTKTTITRIGFGGKIDGFKDNAEGAFEKKHLKAYLKGHKQFRHGFDATGKPLWFPVNKTGTPWNSHTPIKK